MTLYTPGDFFVSRSDTFVSWAIRLGTRSRYSHAGIILTHDGSTIEAFPDGAGTGSVRKDSVVISPPLTSDQRAAIVHEASKLYGIPYGWLDVFAIGLAQFGITLPSVKRRMARYDRLFCSQLVDLAYANAGIALFDDNRLPQQVTPGDLADLAFINGWGVVNVGAEV